MWGIHLTNSPKMEVSSPHPKKGGVCPHTLKCVISFDEQDKLSQRIGVSQKLSLYLLWWLCIYSIWQTGYTEIGNLSQIWPWKSRSINPNTIGILTNVFCRFCLNLVVLSWMGDELLWVQTQNEVMSDFKVKLDVEDQGKLTLSLAWILTKVFCVFCPSLVVLAWTDDEWTHRQSLGWRTHAHTKTDVGNDNTQNWPRVKIDWTYISSHWAIYSLSSILCYVEPKLAYFTLRSSMNQSECDAFVGVICKLWNVVSWAFHSGYESFVILTKFTSLEVPVVILTENTSVEVLGVVILTSSVVVRQIFLWKDLHFSDPKQWGLLQWGQRKLLF